MSDKNSSKCKNELKLFGNVKVLAASALLASLSFVLAYFAKSIFGTGPLRLTFENVPIFFASYMFGPMIGAIIAVCADLLSCLNSGMAPIPLVTIGSVSIAVISGVLFNYVFKRNIKLGLPVSTAVSHIIGSMCIKTVALYGWYGNVVFFRIPIYFGICAVETLLLMMLFKNKGLMSQLGKVLK